MTYNSEVTSIQNDLHRAWQGVLRAVRQMHPSSQIRPQNATDVFHPDVDSGESKFNVGPVVFCVPERANGRGSNLYIAISGWICFGGPRAPDPRRTTLRFGTGVGYFQAKEDHLIHVYGVHYDMDEKLPGHPVFHAQMCSQEEFGATVRDVFNLRLDPGKDLAAGLLRNVRMPTAQMDVFSVITQIGADHLVSETSSLEVQAAFGKLREACDFFVGAAGRLAYLNSMQATHCYRSTHWYARGQSEAV